MNQTTADLMMGQVVSRARTLVKKELNVVLIVYDPGEPNHSQLFTFDGPRTTPEICRELIASLEAMAKAYSEPQTVVILPSGNPGN